MWLLLVTVILSLETFIFFSLIVVHALETSKHVLLKYTTFSDMKKNEKCTNLKEVLSVNSHAAY